MHDLARTRLEPGGAVGDVGEGVRWQDEQVNLHHHECHRHHNQHYTQLLILVTLIILIIRLEWLEEQQARRACTCLELECLMDQR